MKRMLLLAAVLLGVTTVQAALSTSDLMPEAVAARIAATPKAARANAVAEILAALDAMPMSEEEKTEAFITMTRVLLSAGGTTEVLAEIYNSMPVAYLPAVSAILAEADFQQAVNGMDDEQYNELCEIIVKSTSEYIEASGTDAPAVRIGILVATFVQGSSNPSVTYERALAVVPEAMQAAAETYVAAVTSGKTDVLAAAAGVDLIAETPVEDPDANRVFSEDDAFAEDDDTGVRVPLLTRYADDVLAITIDTQISTMYDWESECEIGNALPTLAFFELENVYEVDGRVPYGAGAVPMPSPTYANQYL